MPNPLLKFRSTKVCPPDKYQFTVLEDGHKMVAFDIESLFFQVAEHFRINGYELPGDYRATIEDQNCQRLSGEWCEYESGENFMDGVDGRFGIEDIVNGTRVLASFTLDGAHTVSQEVAEARALSCSRCYMNQPISGCAACYQLLNVVAMVTGNKQTSEDGNLKSCLICHCSNKAQVWVPAEHLAKGVSPQQERQFSRVKTCWKAKELGLL